MDYLSPFKANKCNILVKIKLPNLTQRLFACSDLLSPKDAKTVTNELEKRPAPVPVY